MTDINWTQLIATEQLSEIDHLSSQQPVVIFKHSTRCSISAASLNRLERKWDASQTAGIKPYFLDLIAYRDISNEIATRYGIMHQSPQLLIIQDGKCTYDASHFDISFDELSAKLASQTI